jgi:hypothetical protein
MKADKNISKPREEGNVFIGYKKKGFRNYVADGITYFFPPLVNRARCFSYNLEDGCLYCGNKTFRYYSKAYGKKYYQCEKCWGINH